jgi:hypothetical protein
MPPDAAGEAGRLALSAAAASFRRYGISSSADQERAPEAHVQAREVKMYSDYKSPFAYLAFDAPDDAAEKLKRWLPAL